MIRCTKAYQCIYCHLISEYINLNIIFTVEELLKFSTRLHYSITKDEFPILNKKIYVKPYLFVENFIQQNITEVTQLVLSERTRETS
jgi:hypothetical protein